MIGRRDVLKGTAAAGVLATTGVGRVYAQAVQPIKFSADFIFQGNHAIWALGIKQGLFKAQGLNVTMDRGYGSGDTIVRVASGAYDIGFADINAAVKFNAQNPTRRVISVFQGFDRTLNSIITLKRTGIKVPTDLNGRKMGAPESDASRLMFPAFARANNVDAASIQWSSVAPDIREAVLVQKQVDAISGFTSTSVFNLVRVGIPREDIVTFPYATHGLDLYGNALIVREDYMNAHPDLVRAFVKGTVDGTLAVIKDPDAGIEALHERDALFDTKLERQRLQLVLDDAILTPAVRANGLGTLDPARMALTIKVNAEAYGISNPPTAAELFTDKFLPPKSERTVPA